MAPAPRSLDGPTLPVALDLPWSETLPTATILIPARQDGPPPAAPGEEAAPQSPLMSFLPFLLIGLIFWMVVIGPERRNRKQRDEMLGSLKKGDKVMTTGGLYGRIAEVRDDVIVLQAGEVRLKFARAAIQGHVGDESTQAD